MERLRMCSRRQDPVLIPRSVWAEVGSGCPAADLLDVLQIFGTLCREDESRVLCHYHVVLNSHPETPKLLWSVAVIFRDINAWLNGDHHPRLQWKGARHVWGVVDIHPKVMAHVVRAVSSSSLE